MPEWTCALELDDRRRVVAGSTAELAAAIRRGADVRCYTTFDYGEHMSAPNAGVGLIEEMMNFGVVYRLGDDHAAGIQTTRYPANCSLGFQPLPSLSFFLCNDNGESGIARPCVERQSSALVADEVPDKYVRLDSADGDTLSPCENYTYDFGVYRWWVRERWELVLAHDSQGAPLSGSLECLQEAFRAGRDLKVGVTDLCAELVPEGATAIDHEVFVEMGPIYNHRDQGFLGGESQPVVRVAPGVPLRYRSGGWSFGWLLPRTDGIVHHLVIDPYTRAFNRAQTRCAIRWFAD